jgi:hypothetical protein
VLFIASGFFTNGAKGLDLHRQLLAVSCRQRVSLHPSLTYRRQYGVELLRNDTETSFDWGMFSGKIADDPPRGAKRTSSGKDL